MLVVSNIDLTTDLPTIKPEAFLTSSIRDFTLNINNDYRYLKTGYYVSMHAEILGNPVIPKSRDIIDANRTPILLLKASKAGIPTLPYTVTGSVKQIISEIGLPVIVFAVNPFSYDGYKTAKNKSALYRAVKSLGMNYKFAVCAQSLQGDIITVKSVFGCCSLDTDIKKIVEKVYEVFKIPLCKLHIQRLKDRDYLCGLQPIKREELTPDDLERIAEEISRASKLGERFVV